MCSRPAGSLQAALEHDGSSLDSSPRELEMYEDRERLWAAGEPFEQSLGVLEPSLPDPKLGEPDQRGRQRPLGLGTIFVQEAQ